MALDINTTCTSCTHTRKSHFISDQEEPIPAQIHTVGICIRIREEGERKRVGVYTLAIIIVIIYEHDAGVMLQQELTVLLLHFSNKVCRM